MTPPPEAVPTKDSADASKSGIEAGVGSGGGGVDDDGSDKKKKSGCLPCGAPAGRSAPTTAGGSTGGSGSGWFCVVCGVVHPSAEEAATAAEAAAAPATVADLRAALAAATGVPADGQRLLVRGRRG